MRSSTARRVATRSARWSNRVCGQMVWRAAHFCLSRGITTIRKVAVFQEFAGLGVEDRETDIETELQRLARPAVFGTVVGGGMGANKKRGGFGQSHRCAPKDECP